MAAKYVSKNKAKKKAEKEYRKIMGARQSYAIENARIRASEGGVSPMNGKKSVNYSHTTDQLVGGKIQGTEVDASFVSDIQKMKFCRKPVGFVMWLLYMVLLVAVIAPFILPRLEMDLGGVEQYIAVCMETEATAEDAADGESTETTDESGEDESLEEEADNASHFAILAEGEEEEGEGEESEGEETSSDGESASAEESSSFEGTLYSLSDPLFGWVEFIAGKFNLNLELGESSWYESQVSKTEVGMTDTLASILILAYPPFIVIYLILALVLMVQTFICFASGDRRIFRFTGIENIILLLCGAVILLGCFASTTEIDAAMDLGGIVTFLLGGVTGAGGFTAGYGMLIMLILPLVEFVLSFFLLEKKLRGREITQPIVVYHYKEK